MSVYRIHIRPKGGLTKSSDSFAYCLKEEVLGLGWQTKTQNNNASWDEYETEAREIYDGSRKISRVRYLKNNIKTNDLIWTRDTDGQYYLAKIKSEWEYYSNPKAQAVDIVNIVRCKLVKVPLVDDVPGKVIASFRAPRTIQAIRDETVSDYSKYLWNKLDGTDFYSLSKEKFKNVFSFLGSEETEDVIFVYLQVQGWVAIPNSRKKDTMGYEFYLVNKKTKERAIVQVKTGHAALTPKDCECWNEKGVLFQSNENYKGNSDGNVVCIKRKNIELFMRENRELLPSSIIHWLDVAENTKKI